MSIISSNSPFLTIYPPLPPSDSGSTPASPSEKISPVKIHERFHFEDGNMILMVEDTLYKIHRYFLQTNSNFGKLYLGLLDEDKEHNRPACIGPIRLDGVRSHDFDPLLSMFYPTNFRAYDPKTVNEWSSVLSLSSKWGLARIRDIAIKELANITSAVDRVVLGHAYDIGSWLTPAYMEICTREKPLDFEEGMRLGMRDVILINQIRYDIRYTGTMKCSESEVRVAVGRGLAPPDPPAAVHDPAPAELRPLGGGKKGKKGKR